jgi:hypothetical protein
MQTRYCSNALSCNALSEGAPLNGAQNTQAGFIPSCETLEASSSACMYEAVTCVVVAQGAA